MKSISQKEITKWNCSKKSSLSVLIDIITYIIYAFIKLFPNQKAIQILLLLDNKLYSLCSEAAIRYGNGIHTKHKHINYHAFFINRIKKDETVLDLGCGIGAVAYAVAQGSGAHIIGIDLEPNNIKRARTEFYNCNIEYITGDVLTDIPEKKFNVVIMSNILKHIDDRINFLKRVYSITSAQRLLIRVPLFERDWRVPLKKELNIDYRLDPTHYTEYTHESFFNEMKEAGMQILYFESRWGEIWAEVITDVA